MKGCLSKLEKLFRSFRDNSLINDIHFSQLMRLGECYARFYEQFGAEKTEAVKGLAKRVMEVLAESILSGEHFAVLEPGMVQVMVSIPCLKRRDIGGVNAENFASQDLSRIGVFGKTRDGFITTGFITQRASKTSLPSTILTPNSNVSSLLDGKDERKVQINQISEMYGFEAYWWPVEVSEETREELYIKLREVYVYLKKEFREYVEFLQDSCMFYNHCTQLYSKHSGSIHIFATSPGLVIPEDYFGDQETRKNPMRKKYFRRGIESSEARELKKFYQWDAEKTALKLWEGYSKSEDPDAYKERAVSILSRFLQLENLEISEAPFIEMPWKNLFTLVTDSTFVFSERKYKKISSGLMLENEIMKTNEAAYKDLIGLISRESEDLVSAVRDSYDKGSCTVIKRLDEVYTDAELAEERARDIVEILLEKGRIAMARKEKKGVPFAAREKERQKSYEVFTREQRLLLDEDEVKLWRMRQEEFDLWIYLPKQEIVFQKRPIHLPPKPLGILVELLTHLGEVVYYEELRSTVWDGVSIADDNNTIHRAKKTLVERLDALKEYIVTKTGGYMLSEDMPYSFSVIRRRTSAR